MMSNSWKTTVGELLKVFRGAVIAIIPWLEIAKIKWKDNESYDDYDNICQSLYENIVFASLMGEVLPKYTIAKYGFQYDSYSKIDFINVRSAKHPNTHLAFVSFQSLLSPLDRVSVAILDDSDKVEGFLSLELENLEFEFIRTVEGKKEIISEIIVVV